MTVRLHRALTRLTCVALVGSLAAGPLLAQPAYQSQGTAGTHSTMSPVRSAGRMVDALLVTSDSLDVVTTIARFHAALAAGDSAMALSLLGDDVVILESGGVETRSDYSAHHLPADIAFAQAVPSQRGAITVRLQRDVAWASSTSVTVGDFKGRAINSAGAELMVLTRAGSAWKIRAIHWSSRARRG